MLEGGEGEGRSSRGRGNAGRRGGVDETDIASVEFSTLPLRRTLKNSSKERHVEARESIMGRTKTRKRGIEEGSDREREREKGERWDVEEGRYEGVRGWQ